MILSRSLTILRVASAHKRIAVWVWTEMRDVIEVVDAARNTGERPAV